MHDLHTHMYIYIHIVTYIHTCTYMHIPTCYILIIHTYVLVCIIFRDRHKIYELVYVYSTCSCKHTHNTHRERIITISHQTFICLSSMSNMFGCDIREAKTSIKGGVQAIVYICHLQYHCVLQKH